MSGNPHRQDGCRLRFEWGLSGAHEIAERSWVIAVVDVLSFTTTLTVAMDCGVEVFPHRWRDESAARFAAQHGAVLAVGRSQARPGEVSLSPATVREASGVRRLVLPSPNGSTIAQSMANLDGTVIGVSLRNSIAAAKWTAARLAGDDACGVAVVAAGEQWPQGGLRRAVEDLWGAGAYLAALRDHGFGSISPEAQAAIASFEHVSGDLPRQLRASTSGRELAAADYGHDVDVAAELNRSDAVPALSGRSFRPAPP
ncbi:2-phosphosulfolactate phosphatase [Saccharopolyspora mangrovi]|uniref:Probable 2-phosphosulfolactate phosphatase n=1 Tax=Saccharopolyspora mangrovi TaxID=3082379 RepID=A0ABU6A8F8_9PSEU|nr:2-phosphosulfolactate phosphatase [Saccharopolyspora sp. S2-29]MEB3367837.1 2-phosphosulfolactate phosphatase [Saccharopolyspora sp. S2-29]